MNKLKVSVVIATYNNGPFLDESISSILNDSLKEIEIIIIDDGSTDKTEEIISRMKDNRIIYKKNAKNRGVAYSLNKGIRLSSGKFIAFLGADDISCKNRLLKQNDFLEKRPDIDVCGGWLKTFGKEEKVIKGFKNGFITSQLLLVNCVTHPSVMMKSSIFKNDNFFFNENFDCVIDYELWSRLISKYSFYNISEILVLYRLHENQISSLKKSKQIQNLDEIRRKNLERYLNFDPSKSDMVLNNKIFDMKIIQKELKMAESWLSKLNVKNIDIKKFNRFSYEETLLRYWFIICSNIKETKYIKFKLFYFNKISKRKYPILKIVLIYLLEQFRNTIKELVSFKFPK